MIGEDGFIRFGYDADVAIWAEAARRRIKRELSNPAANNAQMRHQNTWFVGVDVLPNDTNGTVEGVALRGPWEPHVPQLPLHRAQVSIVYDGYPKQDPEESEANHRYRRTRKAAHVDGLLPVGPMRRRYPLELHGYI